MGWGWGIAERHKRDIRLDRCNNNFAAPVGLNMVGEGRGRERRDAQDGTGVAANALTALGAAWREWGWAGDTKETQNHTENIPAQMDPHAGRLK